MAMMKDWSGDANARMVHREIEAAVAPVLARLMPEFNVTKVGVVVHNDIFNERDQVQLRIHLERHGTKLPPEQDFMPVPGIGRLK